MKSFYSNESYYQKLMELQDKLRQSEEERMHLEERFNKMMQRKREKEQYDVERLHHKYCSFLENEKFRNDRNDNLLRSLDRIEYKASMLTARTDRLRQLKHQYENISRQPPSRSLPSTSRGTSPFPSTNYRSKYFEDPAPATIKPYQPDIKPYTPYLTVDDFSTNHSYHSYPSESKYLADNDSKIFSKFITPTVQENRPINGRQLTGLSPGSNANAPGVGNFERASTKASPLYSNIANFDTHAENKYEENQNGGIKGNPVKEVKFQERGDWKNQLATDTVLESSQDELGKRFDHRQANGQKEVEDYNGYEKRRSAGLGGKSESQNSAGLHDPDVDVPTHRAESQIGPIKVDRPYAPAVEKVPQTPTIPEGVSNELSTHSQEQLETEINYDQLPEKTPPSESELPDDDSKMLVAKQSDAPKNVETTLEQTIPEPAEVTMTVNPTTNPSAYVLDPPININPTAAPSTVVLDPPINIQGAESQKDVQNVQMSLQGSVYDPPPAIVPDPSYQVDPDNVPSVPQENIELSEDPNNQQEQIYDQQDPQVYIQQNEEYSEGQVYQKDPNYVEQTPGYNQQDPSLVNDQQDPNQVYDEQDPNQAFDQQDPSQVYDQQDPTLVYNEQDPSVVYDQSDPSYVRDPNQVYEQDPSQVYEQDPNQEYTPDPNQAYEQDQSLAYVQDPNLAYEQDPSQTYEQDPNQTYEQDPSQVYEQDPNPAYDQDPSQVYEQDPNPAYEQDPTQVYEQDPNQAYEQDPNQIYEQDPNQTYEQDPNQVYEQDPNQVYEQDPNQAYVQDPNQVYEQDPNQVYQQDPNQVYEQDPNQVYQQDPNAVLDPNAVQQDPNYIADANYQPEQLEYVQDQHQKDGEEVLYAPDIAAHNVANGGGGRLAGLMDSDTDSTQAAVSAKSESDFEFSETK